MRAQKFAGEHSVKRKNVYVCINVMLTHTYSYTITLGIETKLDKDSVQLNDSVCLVVVNFKCCCIVSCSATCNRTHAGKYNQISI